MPKRDSVDKIVQTYLAGVCRKSFTYRGTSFTPKPVVVSPLITRGYTCPSGCGGCCPRFSLDYLPLESERATARTTERTVEVNSLRFPVLSDMQDDHHGYHCRFVDASTGRCTVYENRPFTCDFELIRFLHYSDHVVITQKLFGRGWAMMRVTGQRGALCSMLPPTPTSIAEVVRKLDRLEAWAQHFSVTTCVPDIVAWLLRGLLDEPLRLPV